MEFTRNDHFYVYNICKDYDLLDSFSVAYFLAGFIYNFYFEITIFYEDSIDYKSIVDSLYDNEDYLSKDDVRNYYLHILGISDTYGDAKKSLRRELYYKLADNKNILERIIEVLQCENNSKGLAEIEDAIELNYRNKKKVLTNTLK